MFIMIIGIPQALFYWKQPYLWEIFFNELGFEVLLSSKTNKEIIEDGVRTADSETCFSIKVLYGHLLFLEGKVDLIFLPRLKKNELGEYCPRFFGLPDLGTILLKTPLLSPKIDYPSKAKGGKERMFFDLSKEDLTKTLIKIGKKLGKRKAFIREAIDRTFSKIRAKAEKAREEYERKLDSSKKKIILISHPYNLHDEYVNLGIKNKLEKLGAEVVCIDEVPLEKDETGRDLSPNFHWEFGREMLAQARKITKEKTAGAIEISAFQCGSDAVVKEFIEREIKEKKIPFLYLLIDEHTAEAGLLTRLEAFIDTIKLR